MSLAPYVDKRVSAKGVFERLTETRGSKVKVALLQDTVVIVNGEEIDLGHLWVQHADNFVNMKSFERVTFLARVGVRKRINGYGGTELIYNLMYPTNIKPKGVPPALRLPQSVPEPFAQSEPLPQPFPEPDSEPVAEREQYGGCDTVQLLMDVSALAGRAGGWKKLEALVTLLGANHE